MTTRLSRILQDCLPDLDLARVIYSLRFMTTAFRVGGVNPK
jgi:hypothetical protein